MGVLDAVFTSAFLLLCAGLAGVGLLLLVAVPAAAVFLAGAGLTNLRLAFSARCSDTSADLWLGFGINTVDPALTRIPAGIALTSRKTATLTPKRFASCSADSVDGTLTAVQVESGSV